MGDRRYRRHESVEFYRLSRDLSTLGSKKWIAPESPCLPPRSPIQRTVLDRLGEVDRFDRRRGCQIGDRARHLEHPVERPGREAEALEGGVEKGLPGRIERAFAKDAPPQSGWH